MTLLQSDPRYWAPVPEVVSWLCRRLPAKANVLEIGPGHTAFPRADTFVDFIDAPVPLGKGQFWIKLDIATKPLPFKDNQFDFVYTRHMLEDMWNPFLILSEMSRVAKAGYIETPSPIAELCRNVDGGDKSLPYRGYHHHRWFIWVNGDRLEFIPKYPVIEYLGASTDSLAEVLRKSPKYWNTYYRWKDRINWKHWQSPLDYDIPREYHLRLNEAVGQSVKATDEFYGRVFSSAAAA